MIQLSYEIRDAIHATIRISADERTLVDSDPVQRLRYIRQLGLTYFVYPGANHSRFEHALGTMELAGRVFDTITNPRNTESLPSVQTLLHQHQDQIDYWRHTVRLAALCHDIGHLPFSHTAEHDLLPKGWSHERLTLELLKTDTMQSLFRSMTLPLDALTVAKLAIGQKKAKLWGMTDLTEWEALLSEIITGDAFGVDRMDYLLRDSHHVGVAYGKIDHHRLIDTIRILPTTQGGQSRFTLGIRQGGLHSAEALMMARYFMFRQVYCHPVSQVYGLYLIEFLKRELPRHGRFDDLSFHQSTTDNEVLTWLREASTRSPADLTAKAILQRDHFKLLYEPKEGEHKNSGQKIYAAAVRKFSPEQFRYQPARPPYGTPIFPVLRRDDQTIDSSDALSELLRRVPSIAADYVFVSADHYEPAVEWLRRSRKRLLTH